MIDEHFDDLEAVTSTKQACWRLGASRATHYRRRRPPVAGPPAPRPAPPNALTEAERQHILAVLHSEEAAHPERFVRKPPQPPALPDAVWINEPKEDPTTTQ